MINNIPKDGEISKLILEEWEKITKSPVYDGNLIWIILYNLSVCYIHYSALLVTLCILLLSIFKKLSNRITLFKKVMVIYILLVASFRLCFSATIAYKIYSREFQMSNLFVNPVLNYTFNILAFEILVLAGNSHAIIREYLNGKKVAKLVSLTNFLFLMFIYSILYATKAPLIAFNEIFMIYCLIFIFITYNLFMNIILSSKLADRDNTTPWIRMDTLTYGKPKWLDSAQRLYDYTRELINVGDVILDEVHQQIRNITPVQLVNIPLVS